MSTLSRVDKILLTFLFLLTGVLTYFLYNDSYILAGIDQTSAQVIGNLNKTVKDVRRKNAENFAWIPTQTTENVFENDSVFTGEGSLAIIQLKDGGELEISENSLVNLSSKNGQMQLDLRFGEFTGKIAEGKTISIRSGKEEFTVKSEKNAKGVSSKINLAKSQSGEFKIKILEGSAKVKTKNDEKSMDQNTLAMQFKENKIETTFDVSKIELLNATNTIYNQKLENFSVPMNWKSTGEISNYKIIVSDNENFSTTILTELTENKNLQAKKSWSPNKYYWKVFGIGKNQNILAESNVGYFEISRIAAPIIISPADDVLEISVKTKKSIETLETKVPIEWKHSVAFKMYQIEIAKDETFEEILQKENTLGLKKILSIKNEVSWIRVRGFQENVQMSDWSKPFVVHILKTEEKELLRPELVNYDIDFKFQKNDDSSSPEISWKKQNEISKSILEIDSDKLFKNPLKLEVSSNSVKWEKYTVGKYFVRLKSISTDGRISPYSEIGTLEIASQDAPLLKKRALPADRGLASASKSVSLEWTAIKRTSKYELLITSSSKTAKLYFSKNEATFPIEASGNVHFQVRAVANDNTPASPYSNTEDQYFSSGIAMPLPVLKEPFNKSTIFLQTETSISVWLEWINSPTATNGYVLQVSDVADFSHLLINEKIKKNRFLLKNELSLGTYYWRVKSLGNVEVENSNWSVPFTFTLYHNSNNQFQGGE